MCRCFLHVSSYNHIVTYDGLIATFFMCRNVKKNYHPRLVGLTIANSQGVGLPIPNRSIHKYFSLPTRDSGYKSRLLPVLR